MCGINGIVGLENEQEATLLIAKMNTSLAHRGPDDEGAWIDKGIALGQRRLSIIDLSTAGHQPMGSYNGRYIIVFNGEIYNYRQLKFDLQRSESGTRQAAYFFKTNTDTEVILAAYLRWGEKCLDHLNGMFAFAIWDTEDRKLFIARDRLGIKPLYYYFNEGLLVFSSELRALLSCGMVPRKLNKNSLPDYLRYQTVHAPDTIIDCVNILLPGHSMQLQNSNLTISCYWDLIEKSINPKLEKKTRADYTEVCKNVNTLLTKAVERRLVADVPFGAFLSGGIDSSAIVGLMAKVATDKVKTFNVSFDEGEFSESKYAQLIARKFNTEHHEIKLSPADFLQQLPQAISAIDHPTADGLNTYIVAKATRNAGITMALSGLGGDELFAGYAVFKRTLELNKKWWLNATPQVIKNNAAAILKFIKPGIAADKIAELLRTGSVNFKNSYPLSRQVLLDAQINSLLNSHTLPVNRVSESLKKINTGSKKQISAVSIAEIQTYMQNVLLRDTDQMSMAHALEVRVPFLDFNLVEYVLGLPDELKFPHTPKKLLTDALGDLLPPEISNRPKMGFTFPWEQWMKNELKSFCEQRIVSLSKRAYFNEVAVTNLWKQFIKGDKQVNWSRLWMLVVLENWLIENNIEA